MWTGEVRFNEQWLDQPLRWKRPRRIFVFAHGDLFHENVPDEWIDRIFAIMALAPQHTFQVLTKRAERMYHYFEDHRPEGGWTEGYVRLLHDRPARAFPRAFERLPLNNDQPFRWPLPNVWLGVSVENHDAAEARVPWLLQTPAAVRWLSCEPLLGPIELEWIDDGCAHRDVPREEWGMVDDDDSPPGLWWNALTGERTIMHGGATGDWSRRDAHVDWVIVGGESGRNARPMHPEWARSIRNQCESAGVPLFFKQFGEWLPEDQVDPNEEMPAHSETRVIWSGKPHSKDSVCSTMLRTGKKTAGRRLDFREHSAYPR